MADAGLATDLQQSREELARRMGGEERIQRQHDNGRLTVRERIDALVNPGSFHRSGGDVVRFDASS